MSATTQASLDTEFRAVAEALDQLPPAEEADFLARLVLILADELRDAGRFCRAIERARSVGSARARQ